MFRYRGFRPYRYRRNASLVGPIVFLALALALVHAVIALIEVLAIVAGTVVIVAVVAIAVSPALRGLADRTARDWMPETRARALLALNKAREIVRR